MSWQLHLCWIILNFTSLIGNASLHDHYYDLIFSCTMNGCLRNQYSCTSMEQLDVNLKYQSGIGSSLRVGDLDHLVL